MLFKRDRITSIQSDNVEDICEINNVLMIEAELTKTNKAIGKLKDDSVYLLNGEKYILQKKTIEIFMNDDNKMDKNADKVLSLTTELLKKKN